MSTATCVGQKDRGLESGLHTQGPEDCSSPVSPKSNISERRRAGSFSDAALNQETGSLNFYQRFICAPPLSLPQQGYLVGVLIGLLLVQVCSAAATKPGTGLAGGHLTLSKTHYVDFTLPAVPCIGLCCQNLS